MRTIIAGSRGVTDYAVVCEAMSSIGEDVTEVVSGGAFGVDMLGEQWARNRNIPVKLFPVTPMQWQIHGKSAGPKRNRAMAEYASALVAIWDGKSKGTKNMIEEAEKCGLTIFIHRV